MRTILYGVKPPSNLEFELAERAGTSNIMPGDRVIAYEHMLFKNDKTTPAKSLMRTGTVVRRYGELAYTYDTETAMRYKDGITGPYPDLLEIEMDEIRPTGDRIMKGCFTYGVKKFEKNYL